MRVVHILHHSVSPFSGQFPDQNPLHYDSGFPMLFARQSRQRNPDIEVECWRPECSLGSEYTWQDEIHQITHRIFPSVFFRYGWELSIPMLKAAAKHAKSGRWCFLVHGSYNLHAYSLARVLSGAPAILQSHGGLPAMARMKASQRKWSAPLFFPLALIEGRSLPLYPHIFAVNTLERASIEEAFPGTLVSFSPVAIDFDLFSPGDRLTSRNQLGLPMNSQIILFVGRLAPGKGIRHLLDAIAILAKRFPRIESFVVGSGPCESYLREHAKTLGIESHVHFVGYVNHDMLVDWYRAADLLCLPSMFEGFPLTAAEAMACGTPIVASHVGGLPDVVNAFECGILVPPRDPGALSAAIEQMLLNQSNAIPNTEKARESLDWSAKLNRINDLFSEMASS